MNLKLRQNAKIGIHLFHGRSRLSRGLPMVAGAAHRSLMGDAHNMAEHYARARLEVWTILCSD